VSKKCDIIYNALGIALKTLAARALKVIFAANVFSVLSSKFLLSVKDLKVQLL